MMKTHKGSCHCGKVRYEADFDLGQGTGKCNCSICTKFRWWSAFMKPAQFRLVAGKDELSDYSPGSGQGHNMFCRHCGVRTHSWGHVPEIGGDFVTINVATLDEVAPEELAAAPVRYMDGRANDWFNAPKVTSYL